VAADAVLSLGTIKLGEEFELDLGGYELCRAGQSVKLARIPMELLLLLVEQRGQLVTREQIVARIWGKEVFLDTDNSINAAVRRIRQVFDDNPDEPRFIQTVIGRGYRFIAPVEIPQPEPALVAEPAARAKPPLTMRAMFILLLIVTVLAGFTVGGLRKRLFRSSVASDLPIQDRPSMAVLGFRNLSGDAESEWISTALSEMVSADLAAGQKVRLLPGETVARMKNDLALPVTDSYGPETLARIREYLNADTIVLGSYLATGQAGSRKIHINLRIEDAKSGEVIAVSSEDGTEADLAKLVSRSDESVRRTLHFAEASADDTTEAREALPTNPMAARYYAEGLARWRSFDPLAAADLFTRAIAADPAHALSHAALSECLANLGYDLKAQEEGKKAVELSSKLSREQQLSIEARYRAVTHNWARAIQVYQMLWEFFPDNIDYGIGLAKAQYSGGTAKDAAATVDALEKRASGDPRVDLVEAMAADRLGDLHREEKAAARAVEKGHKSGARSVTAGGLLTRGSALSALGDNTNAISSLKEAQSIFSSLGDKQGVARVLNNLGIIARHQGNLPDAQRLLEQALEVSRQIGSQLSIRQALNNLANVMWQQGNTSQAMAYHQQSLRLNRELGDKSREAISLSNIAGLLVLQGKLEETRRTYEDSLRIAHEIGDHEGEGLALINISDTLLRMGQLDAAKKQAEAGLAMVRQVGNKSLEGYALYQIGAIQAAQGDLEAARARYQECAALREKLGEKVTEAETQLSLAQIRLDTGDPKGAEQEARRIAGVFHTDGPSDDEAMSDSLLAEALLGQGKFAEAQQASSKSMELLPKAMDLATHLQVEIMNAYVTGRSNAGTSETKLAAATRALETALAKASRMGYGEITLEARLRVAELQFQSGKTTSGRLQLEQLHKDAQAQGFVLVARKASNSLHENSLRALAKK
jgi:tetratricopeptide (TPR) repeat protein/DNA-binding winged helix-turn-helix (wHTH) protein